MTGKTEVPVSALNPSKLLKRYGCRPVGVAGAGSAQHERHVLFSRNEPGIAKETRHLEPCPVA
jgi:hypothetical protein